MNVTYRNSRIYSVGPPPRALFSQTVEMSQAACWFLLCMFVALCAVVASMFTRSRKGSDTAEDFTDSADYTGPDTRPPPADLEIEDPDLDSLAPGEHPGMDMTPPSELAMRGRDSADMLGDGGGASGADDVLTDTTNTDLDDPGMGDADGAYDGVEPFAGEEYEAFTTH